MNDRDHDPSGATVTYTTKELLARIEGKLDALAANMATKASQMSVDHLDVRVARLEEEVATLKQQRAQLTLLAALAMFVAPIIVVITLHYT